MQREVVRSPRKRSHARGRTGHVCRGAEGQGTGPRTPGREPDVAPGPPRGAEHRRQRGSRPDAPPGRTLKGPGTTPARRRRRPRQTEHHVQRSTVDDVLRTPGSPLDDATRTEMEARLGADFSDVRIHTGEAARASAAEVGARAYTSGSHVVIGEGGADRHTLAHELTHVIQQRRGPVAGTDNGSGLRVSDPSDRFEREAEANATRVLSGPVPGRATQGPAERTGYGPESVQRSIHPYPTSGQAPDEKVAKDLVGFGEKLDAAVQIAWLQATQDPTDANLALTDGYLGRWAEQWQEYLRAAPAKKAEIAALVPAMARLRHRVPRHQGVPHRAEVLDRSGVRPHVLRGHAGHPRQHPPRCRPPARRERRRLVRHHVREEPGAHLRKGRLRVEDQAVRGRDRLSAGDGTDGRVERGQVAGRGQARHHERPHDLRELLDGTRTVRGVHGLHAPGHPPDLPSLLDHARNAADSVTGNVNVARRQEYMRACLALYKAGVLRGNSSASDVATAIGSRAQTPGVTALEPLPKDTAAVIQYLTRNHMKYGFQGSDGKSRFKSLSAQPGEVWLQECAAHKQLTVSDADVVEHISTTYPEGLTALRNAGLVK
ncbi:eCIS core domain-containing protein [Streptomyces lasalocidi]